MFCELVFFCELGVGNSLFEYVVDGCVLYNVYFLYCIVGIFEFNNGVL